MPDAIQDGKNGCLVGFHDPDAIAGRIEALWSSPTAAQSMSSEAAKRAREYSWDRVAVETAAFYERLLAMRKPVREN